MQLFVSDVCLGALAEISGTLGTSVCTTQPVQIQKSEVNVYKRDTVSGVCSLLTCQPEDKIDNRNRKVWSLYQYINICVYCKREKTPH